MAVGGMALLGGVFLAAGAHAAAAVRLADGSIITRAFPTPAATGRIRRIPGIRGLFVGTGVARGLEAMRWAITAQDARQTWIMKRSTAVVLTTMVAVMAVVFALAPAVLGAWAAPRVALPAALVEAVLRIGLLVGYLCVVKRHALIGDLFAYHGAEHKCVAAFEHGAALTVAGARPYPRAHVRCGTTLLFSVLVFASLLVVPLGALPTGLALGVRPLVLFGSVAVAYEVQRACAAHMDRTVARVLMAPGLWLQRLTTHEPSDAQLEVGLAALELALASGVPPGEPTSAG